MWSSAAVAHLLQGSTCCVFRDCILHTLVVTSGYLSYCCLSIISNQSAHSPLTSDINKAFSSTQLPLTGYFLFFGPFSLHQGSSISFRQGPNSANNTKPRSTDLYIYIYVTDVAMPVRAVCKTSLS